MPTPRTGPAQPARNMGRFGFGYTTALPALPAGSVLMTLEPASAPAERFRLHLQCLVTPDGLTAEIHYDRARLAAVAVDCLAEQWLTLLADALRAPDRADRTLVIAECRRTRAGDGRRGRGRSG